MGSWSSLLTHPFEDTTAHSKAWGTAYNLRSWEASSFADRLFSQMEQLAQKLELPVHEIPIAVPPLYCSSQEREASSSKRKGDRSRMNMSESKPC
jgi:hypothetical protein